MRPDAEVYSNTVFSLCNRFIRETLSGNAEGYKVFCIQLDKSLRKESKMVQTKKQHALFDNCPFVCINFDFSWLNKARPDYRYIWVFNQTASVQSVAWIL